MQRNQSDRKQAPVRSELAEALAACRGAFYGTAVISGMSNILMLTGAMFMLEIYDRVLPSRSVPTLVALGLLAGAAYALYTYASSRAIRSAQPSRGVMGAMFGNGAVLLLPVLLVTGAPLLQSWSTVAIAGYLAIGPMFVAYLLFGAGLR